MAVAAMRCSIFCKIIDNLGDAGVSWRLARQLHKAGIECTLLIDQLATLAQLVPEININLSRQIQSGIHVHHWTQPTDPLALLDHSLWIECFACGWGEPVWQALAQCDTPPRLYLLDYLGTEAWVSGCHALDSIHPRTGLRQRFWIPGFSRDTGGLLRESAMETLPVAKERPADLPLPASDRLISLFCYAQAPLAGLLEYLHHENYSTTLVVFPGPSWQALDQACQTLHLPTLSLTAPTQCAALCMQPLPLLHPTRYDQLLQQCDLNLVRGEDSFVRAHWAGRPLLWHAYPQPENAHLAKVCGWLAQRPSSPAFRHLQQVFNQGNATRHDYANAFKELEAESACVCAFRQQLLQQTSLVERLLADTGLFQ